MALTNSCIRNTYFSSFCGRGCEIRFQFLNRNNSFLVIVKWKILGGPKGRLNFVLEMKAMLDIFPHPILSSDIIMKLSKRTTRPQPIAINCKRFYCTKKQQDTNDDIDSHSTTPSLTHSKFSQQSAVVVHTSNSNKQSVTG